MSWQDIHQKNNRETAVVCELWYSKKSYGRIYLSFYHPKQILVEGERVEKINHKFKNELIFLKTD